MSAELVAIALLAFVAGAVYTSVGFGLGLVFVPAATLIVGAEPSIATMLVATPLVGFVLYGLDTPRTPLRDTAPVAALSLLSAPVGIWLLVRSDEDLLRLLVGVVVLASVAVDRVNRQSTELERQPRLALAAASDLASGLMRGATSMGGPPLVLYYHWLGGGAWRFRSRMFSSVAIAGVPTLVIAVAGDVFKADAMPVVLASMPPIAVGIVVGIRLRPLIGDRELRRISMLLLVATSLLAIVTAASALA